MKVLLISIIIVGSVAASPNQAAAEPPPGFITTAQSLAAASSAMHPRAVAQQAPRSPSRDSLKNGTIIGAVVGAVALGTLGALVCNIEREPGGPRCGPDVFRVAAIGAAIGAGAGLTVDAALSRQGGVALLMGITF